MKTGRLCCCPVAFRLVLLQGVPSLTAFSFKRGLAFHSFLQRRTLPVCLRVGEADGNRSKGCQTARHPVLVMFLIL